MNPNLNYKSILSSRDDAYLRQALNIVYIYSILTHLVFFFAFRQYGIKPMVYLNSFSPFLYLIAIFLNKNKRVVLGAIIAALEAVFHGAISVVFVGWNANFHLYIILVYLLIFFLFSLNIRVRISMAFVITAIYVVLYASTLHATPLYVVPNSFVLTAGIVNIINTAFVLSLFAIAYSYFIRKNMALLVESEKKQRELNAQKNKFFSIFSHDLKNPISSLHSFLDLLLQRYDTMDEEKRLNYLNQVYSAVGDTYSLLNDLLEWSRSQMDNIKIEPEQINVSKVINDIRSLFDHHATSKNIDLKVSLKENISLYADNQMFHSIVRNLVSNAIKYSHPGSIVKIVAEKEQETTIIKVVDYGIGISEERQKELFSIEKNEIVTGTANERGTGLGLIVVKDFVEKNNGHLSFKSELNKGTSFVLTFPNS